MTDFETAIHNWLKEQDINCGFYFDDNFAYNTETNKIQIGIISYHEISRWFEQFLYEYGLEYSGILDPVLAFLHELGHYFTFDTFTNEEWLENYLIKYLTCDDRMENQDDMNRYWEIPDEFAANMWAINFINSHIEAVEKLCNIYFKYWESFIAQYE